MASSRWIIFFFSTVVRLTAFTVAQQQKALDQICVKEKGTFTRNSIYQANLKHALSSLTLNTKINSGFYIASSGIKQNQVNAMALCRGDVTRNNCRYCINRATFELQKRCPNWKEAVIWYDSCMLRYSYRYFFRNVEFGPWFWMFNSNRVANRNTFNRVVLSLLNRLKNQAASGSSLRKFATGNATVPNSRTIYALVQCTPDLTKKQCSDCINQATSLLSRCCNGKQGGRVIAPSCNFRYEINRFYA